MASPLNTNCIVGASSATLTTVAVTNSTTWVTMNNSGNYVTGNLVIAGTAAPQSPLYAKDDDGKTVLEITGDIPILRTKYGDIDLEQLVLMTQQMADVLCSVKASMEQLAEYPALENAYTHYKIIERIVREPPCPKS